MKLSSFRVTDYRSINYTGVIEVDARSRPRCTWKAAPRAEQAAAVGDVGPAGVVPTSPLSRPLRRPPRVRAFAVEHHRQRVHG